MSILSRSSSALAATLVFAIATPALAQDPPNANEASSDGLEQLRERFRQGMEKYRAGQFAEAIIEWESIYADLGPEKGYRLSFNLARAYDARGNMADRIRAAEHYDDYVSQVEKRRSAGEVLEANVERQEQEARARIDALSETIGRIAVPLTDQSIEVRIPGKSPRMPGFVAYVAPGTYAVVLIHGKTTTQNVVVRAGEIVEIALPGMAPAAQRPAPKTDPVNPGVMQTQPPFSPIVLGVAAGVTLASVILPIVTYANASSIKDEYDDPNTDASTQARLQADYSSARSNAYLSLAVPIGLAVGTAALTAWYLLGSREVRLSGQPKLRSSTASLDLSIQF